MLLMEHVSSVVEVLARVRSLCVQFGVEYIEKVEIHRSKQCVRILGSEEKTELVQEMYAVRGRTISKLFPDRCEAGWCFYVR